MFVECPYCGNQHKVAASDDRKDCFKMVCGRCSKLFAVHVEWQPEMTGVALAQPVKPAPVKPTTPSPSPWKLDPEPVILQGSAGSRSARIIRCNLGGSIAAVWWVADDPEAQANVDLILHSPVVLGALEQMASWYAVMMEKILHGPSQYSEKEIEHMKDLLFDAEQAILSVKGGE